MPRRVMVIGLDCVPPRFLFERFRPVMPCVSRLLDAGTFGPLHSCVPPITLPAWTCMFSGRDPGELGIYGFRNRRPGSYALELAGAGDITASRTWEIAARAGRPSAALFVPPSYPPSAAALPVRALTLISCFMTPGPDSPYTSPPGLARELTARFGPYRMDVEHFRTDERRRILAELYAMGEQHFAIAEHVWRTREPDLMVMVEIGPDRFHHAFLDAIDPDHPRFDPKGPFAAEGERYYAFLDRQVGRLADLAGDDTTILIVSDHGARPLRGGIALNQWLLDHGYLALREPVLEPTPPPRLPIDWRATRAWAEGGYYGRIFLNVAGREPEGAVAPEDAPLLLTELAKRLRALPGPRGEPLAHRVLTPEQCYREVRGQAPDLMVFLDDLGYRAVGTLGHDALYLPGNDTGPDGCNHDWHGVFAMSGGGAPARGRVGGYEIYDVHRTVLGLLGLPGDPDALGVDRSGAEA